MPPAPITPQHFFKKAYIAQLVPNAAWLVDESPSPPIGQILVKYLPSLEPRAKFDGKPVVIPRPIRKALATAVERRNKLVHAGAERPPIDEVIAALDAISNLLWLLDYHLGHAWAQTHLSYETQVELGLQPGT
jgi:hypothetical protein